MSPKLAGTTGKEQNKEKVEEVLEEEEEEYVAGSVLHCGVVKGKVDGVPPQEAGVLR